MFYEKLKDMCLKKGLSVNALTNQLHLSNSTATKWKRGSKPRYNTLLQIADYFNVDTEYFFDDKYTNYEEWLAGKKQITESKQNDASPPDEESLFYKKIMLLCMKDGISISRLCENIGLTTAISPRWRKGSMPSSSTLVKMAKYFDVDINYLTDEQYLDYEKWLIDKKGVSKTEVNVSQKAEETNSTIEDSFIDEELVFLIKKLSPNQVQRVKDFLRGMLA